MSEVTSVNGKTGAVVLKAAEVEAVATSEVGQPSGVASLNGSGELPEAQLPSSVVNSSAATISPKTYGAKWDGVTDDTKPLEEAIAASVAGGGIPIVLPAGTGVINGAPRIPKNLEFVIPIRGAGMYDTTVKMTTALTFLKFANTAPGDTVGNLDLSEFTVDGQGVQETENKVVPVVCGTDINSNERVNIKNVHVRRVRTINIPNWTKKVATADTTGVLFPLGPCGEVLKLTWSAEPTVKFAANRA
jgi:Pectate lyase superfamily protein